MKTVRIVYCRPCGYMERALDLARDILAYFEDVKVELEQGKNGVFDVYLNDAKIFSRYEERRFPENEEILKKIASS